MQEDAEDGHGDLRQGPAPGGEEPPTAPQRRAALLQGEQRLPAEQQPRMLPPSLRQAHGHGAATGHSGRRHRLVVHLARWSSGGHWAPHHTAVGQRSSVQAHLGRVVYSVRQPGTTFMYPNFRSYLRSMFLERLQGKESDHLWLSCSGDQPTPSPSARGSTWSSLERQDLPLRLHRQPLNNFPQVSSSCVGAHPCPSSLDSARSGSDPCNEAWNPRVSSYTFDIRRPLAAVVVAARLEVGPLLHWLSSTEQVADRSPSVLATG